VSDEQMHDAERQWIKRFRDEGYALVNEADGGPGRPGQHPADDVSRAAAARTGIKHKPHVFKDIQTQVVSGGRGAHNRWHVARGIVSNDCTHCVLG
jgi:hypothetical protein